MATATLTIGAVTHHPGTATTFTAGATRTIKTRAITNTTATKVTAHMMATHALSLIHI